MMDYGEVARSIRSVWTLRFATIAQSSSLSLAMDSIVWKRSSSLSGFTNWRIVTDDHLFEMAWLYEISGLSDLETTWSLLLLRGACLGRHAVGWLLPSCELLQSSVHLDGGDFLLGRSFSRVEQSALSPTYSDTRMVLLRKVLLTLLIDRQRSVTTVRVKHRREQNRVKEGRIIQP